MKVKVALVQYKFIPNDTQKNLAKISRTVKKIVAENLKMDLIVFPEYALLGGYPYGKTRKLAIIKNGEIINKMQKLAQKHNVNFIPGSFILNDNNQHYNATCFINNNGEIIHWYKKNQLWKI